MYIFLTTKPTLKVILHINWLNFSLAISKEEIHKLVLIEACLFKYELFKW